jgi:hypothetical protein
VLKAGFMDGAAGLIVSTLNSYYVFLKLAKLWELGRPSSGQRTTSNEQRITSNEQRD